MARRGHDNMDHVDLSSAILELEGASSQNQSVFRPAEALEETSRMFMRWPTPFVQGLGMPNFANSPC